MGLARPKAREQGGGQNVGGNAFLDGRVDGPAPLPAVGDIAGERRQFAIAGQGLRGKVEQPRGNYAAAPPDLGDVGEIQIETVFSRQCGAALAGEHVEAFGIGLHQSIFDAVMNHFDEVAGADRPGVDIAFFGPRVGARGPFGSGNIAKAGGQGLEDRIEPVHDRLVAADHHAIAPFEAPDAA